MELDYQAEQSRGQCPRASGRIYLRTKLAICLAVLLATLLSIGMGIPTFALAEDDPSAIDGVFYKCSDSMTDSENIPMSYHWSDTYFEGSSSEFSLPLADMTLCMEMAMGPRAMSWDDNQFTDGDVNIRALATELGFYDFQEYDLTSPSKAEGTIGTFIATRDMTDEKGPYKLVFAGGRGLMYNLEWYQNMYVGSTGDHTGFSQTADNFKARIDAYLQRFSSDERVKLWITGYSRTAAVANLTAARYDQEGTYAGDNLFAYCFATPQGTTDTGAHDAKYDNIHNFVNTADLVPKVAMSEWGFTRYGQDHLFHAAPNNVEGGYQTTEDAINAELKVLNSKITYNVSTLTPTKLSSTLSNQLLSVNGLSNDAASSTVNDPLGLAGDDGSGLSAEPAPLTLLEVVTAGAANGANGSNLTDEGDDQSSDETSTNDASALATEESDAEKTVADSASAASSALELNSSAPFSNQAEFTTGLANLVVETPLTRSFYATAEQDSFAEVSGLYVGASASQRSVISTYVDQKKAEYQGMPLVLLKQFPQILTDAYARAGLIGNSEPEKAKFKVEAKVVVDALTGVAAHDVATTGGWYTGTLSKYASLLMLPHTDEVALSFVRMAETNSQPTAAPTSSQCAGYRMVTLPSAAKVSVINESTSASEATFQSGVATNRTNDWIHARMSGDSQVIYLPLGTSYELEVTSDSAFDANTTVEEYSYRYPNNGVTRKECLPALSVMSNATLCVELPAVSDDAVLKGSTVQYKQWVDGQESTVKVWRLYNRWSGEHLFTTDKNEYDSLVKIGWNGENVAWVSPRTSNTPVYRMYNPYSGDHFYTSNKTEYENLEKIGWKKEGVAFYSVDDSVGVSLKKPIYRLFNPWLTQGTHLYTSDEDEYHHLADLGWNQERIEFYALNN